ncbi:MAG: V-type ATPase subunit, partial [Candidatus Nezhaarchaeota archaeon]|nr:V-type ATPase subunit [Candidatus Nezhaarchaeota archaeon]
MNLRRKKVGIKLGLAKRVETYGYVTARLRARKAFLLTPADYESLLKAASLKDALLIILKSPIYGRYLKGIEEEGGVEGIEQKLRKAYLELLNEVKLMIRGPTSFFLDHVLQKFELEALKAVLKAKALNIPASEALRLIVPAGRLTRAKLEELLRAKDLIRAILIIEDEELQRRLLAASERSKEFGGTFPLEAAIDRYAFSLMSTGIEKLPELDRKWVSKLVGTEADLKNIVLLVRSYLLKVGIEEYKEYVMLPFSYKVASDLLVKLLTSPNIETLTQALASQTRHGALLLKTGSDPAVLERETQRYMISEYRKVFLQSPFHMGFIYSLLSLIHLELRDLRAIIVGKHD